MIFLRALTVVASLSPALVWVGVASASPIPPIPVVHRCPAGQVGLVTEWPNGRVDATCVARVQPLSPPPAASGAEASVATLSSSSSTTCVDGQCSTSQSSVSCVDASCAAGEAADAPPPSSDALVPDSPPPSDSLAPDDPGQDS